MKDFTSRLSLYDILSMVIPGGTIFLFLSLAFGNQLSIDQSKISPVLGWTIALVISYLLGLINHVCTAILWKPFRNNPEMLRFSQQQALHERKATSTLILDDMAYIKYCQMFCCERVLFLYIIPAGTIFLILGKYICQSFLALAPVIIWTIIIVYGAARYFGKKTLPPQVNKQITTCYYKAYYYALKNRYSDDIPTMEGQVAFMQNMILPLLLLLALSSKGHLSNYCDQECTIILLAAIVILLLLPTIYSRQNTIYRRVWEDYEFLKRLEHEKTDK